MRKIALTVASLVLLVVLSACAPAAAPTPMVMIEKAEVATVMPAAPAEGLSFAAETGFSNDVQRGSSENRIVIKNADVTIVVAEPAQAMDTIGKMAEEMGGFVVSSQLYKIRTEEGIEVPEATITVRVPAERLNEAMNRIKGLVEDVKTDILSENVTGQDVTKEYTDLKSQLTNLEHAQKRLISIMEEATKTEDVLAVYRELKAVEEQIEVIKGQIKYYEEASALSAIQVTIRSKEAVKPLTIGGWQPVGVARDALQALINALKIIANIAIWAVIFCLPLTILLGVPGFFVVRSFIRWQRKRKAMKKATAETETKE
ncbi:MAG: DUF4349 domain-containing protein [Anaerolineales bacterium]